MEIAKLVNNEENGCRFQERTLDRHATYMVSNYQEMVAGVIVFD